MHRWPRHASIVRLSNRRQRAWYIHQHFPERPSLPLPESPWRDADLRLQARCSPGVHSTQPEAGGGRPVDRPSDPSSSRRSKPANTISGRLRPSTAPTRIEPVHLPVFLCSGWHIPASIEQRSSKQSVLVPLLPEWMQASGDRTDPVPREDELIPALTPTGARHPGHDWTDATNSAGRAMPAGFPGDYPIPDDKSYRPSVRFPQPHTRRQAAVRSLTVERLSSTELAQDISVLCPTHGVSDRWNPQAPEIPRRSAPGHRRIAAYDRPLQWRHRRDESGVAPR